VWLVGQVPGEPLPPAPGAQVLASVPLVLSVILNVSPV
jgi:hypothetical protein